MGRPRSFVAATAVVAATASVLVPIAVAAPTGAVAPRAVAAAGAVDPDSRASVLDGYRSSLVPARPVGTGWTGDAATCRTGAEAAASTDATRAAVNYYRSLNRLPAVTMDSGMNAKALTAAMVMQANGRISHTPPASWRCYTAGAAATAGSSNLAHGAVGARAVDLYMADQGESNTVAGHRRWLLDPRAATFGTGSTAGFNALTVIGGATAARPSGVSWIAWPNAGFVPKRALRPPTGGAATVLFSLSSSTHPGASYAGAAVTVKVGATPLAVEVHPTVDGYGDNTLTWDVTPPADYDTSDADVRFDITVSGMKSASGAAIPTRSYSSTAIVDATAPATAPGAPTGVTATAGKARATVSWRAPSGDGGSPITGYRVTPYRGATAQPVRTFATAATSQAVTGLTDGTAYTFRVQAVNATGTSALSAASAVVTPTATPPPHGPYGSWSHLVDQVHRHLIGRLPTSAERDRWMADLQTGASTPGDLVAALRQSSLHRTIVDPLTRLYRAYYLRDPDKGGLEYWIAQRQGGWSLVSISAFFARSSEFTARYGTLTDRQFTEMIYRNILGRPGEPGGVTYWTGEVSSRRRSRGGVMLGFSESREHTTAQASEVTVAALFLLWVDRPPTPEERSAGIAALDGGQSPSAYAHTLLPKAAVLAP